MSSPAGVLAIACWDLSKGKTFFMNERVTFHTDSAMRTPVITGTFRLTAAGKFSISYSMVVKNSFTRIFDGSTYRLYTLPTCEKDLYTHEGDQGTIYNYIN